MTRLDTFLLLLLAGIGWGCGFALIGFAVFRGVPGNASLAAIFAGFGFAAGVTIAAIRLALERQLPRSLAMGLRSSEVQPDRARIDAVAPASARVSVFGA
ncbi:hypothetical protein [Ideonella sp. A 288]|uniref:hypothetical protein n=1 Tax=Ideonella sp. A 288 TaxID=1962181 RepID=UPI000B4B8EFF|nr:hypothetical protein [Ideonella sp. A 288]